MSGPGGSEVGRVAIRVVPNTDNFPTALRSFLERMENRNRLEIPLDLDTGTAAAELSAFEKRMEQSHKIDLKVGLDRSALSQASSALRSLSSSLGGVGKATAITSLGLAAAAAVPAILQLGAALVPVVGVLPVALAGATALVPALGALVIGFRGFGDALSSMDDPEKFAEALKNLAPSAQQAATAIRDLRPPFEDLRKEVQGSLFEDFGEQITAIANQYLPSLRTGLTGIATGLNTMGHGLASFIADAQTLKDTNRLFEITGESILGASAGIQPLMSGLRDIGAVGAEYLTPLSDAFVNASQRFAEFAAQARASGAIDAWIISAVDALQKLGSIVASVGSIFASLSNAASNAGMDMLTVLSSALSVSAQWLKTAEGMSVLEQIFGGVQAAAAGLAPVFQALGSAITNSIAPAIAQLGPMIGQAFTNLAPAIEPLGRILAAVAPLIGMLAQSLGSALASALTAVAPLVERFSAALQDNPALLNAVGVAIGAIVLAASPLGAVFSVIGTVISGVVAGFRLLQPVLAPLVASLTGAGGALGSIAGRVTGLLGPIGLVVGAFITLFTTSEEFRSAIGSLASAIGGVLSAAFSVIGPILQGLSTLFTGLVQALAPVVSTIISAVVPVITTLASVLSQLAAALAPVVTAIVGALLPIAGIIGQVFTEIVAAVMPFINILIGILIPTIQSLVPVITAAFSIIQAAVVGALNIISGIVTAVMAAIKGDWSGAWEAIKGVAQSVLTALGGIVRGALNLIGSIIAAGLTLVLSIFTGTWNKVSSATSSGVSRVLSVVRSLPGQIRGFFAAAGSWLVSAGKNIIMGLINGIKGAVGAAVSAVKGAVSGVISAAKGALGIHSPSRVFMEIGAFTAEGMALGIKRNTSDVLRASERMARQASVGASSNVTMTARQESFGDITGQLATAINGSTLLLDQESGRTVAKLYNKEDQRARRR